MVVGDVEGLMPEWTEWKGLDIVQGRGMVKNG